MKEAQPRNADAGKYHLFHGLAIVHDQASLRRLRNLAALGWLGGVLRRSATQMEPGSLGTRVQVAESCRPWIRKFPKAPAALPASARGG